MGSNFRVQQYRPGEEVPNSGIYKVVIAGTITITK